MPYFDVKSPRRGARIRLDAPFFVVGRGERIPIFHDDPSISREHAAIVIRASGVRVRDLGSKNGVLLNGQTIGRYAEVDVKPGDVLRVGATTLVLREGEPPARAKSPERFAETIAAPVVAAPPSPPPAAAAEAPPAEAPPVLNADTPPPANADEPVEDLSKLDEEPPPLLLMDSSEDDADVPEAPPPVTE